MEAEDGTSQLVAEHFETVQAAPSSQEKSRSNARE
jgi:hypothetical protein